MDFHRLSARGRLEHSGLVWSVVGLLAAVSACSSTSDNIDAGLDALRPADVLGARPDLPPAQEVGAPDTTGDSPVDPRTADAVGSDASLTPDAAAAPLDSLPAREGGAQDARAISDTPGNSPDLLPKDVADPDAGPSQDTRAVSLDSSSVVDAPAVDALLASDGAGAKLDAVQITPVTDPGTPVITTSKAGTGVCEGRTVSSLIDEIYASNPTVRGGGLYNGAWATDGSYTYAFVRSDGGFSFVFQYGSGDCPSGCIEHEYWYFQTDGDCVPRQVGHYRPIGLSCGTPLWGIPGNAPPATLSICP